MVTRYHVSIYEQKKVVKDCMTPAGLEVVLGARMMIGLVFEILYLLSYLFTYRLDKVDRFQCVLESMLLDP